MKVTAPSPLPLLAEYGDYHTWGDYIKVKKPKPAGVYARIRKFNAVDLELYEHFNKRLDVLLANETAGELEAGQAR